MHAVLVGTLTNWSRLADVHRDTHAVHAAAADAHTAKRAAGGRGTRDVVREAGQVYEGLRWVLFGNR